MCDVIRSATLPGGLTIPHVERGDRDGLPMLLLHGLTDSWRSFERLLPYMPRRLRAIALTQRGHGDAGRPAQGYRPADLAADLAAFMDTLSLPRAVVVGHSMGSQVAQRFALGHPDRLLGLVLISGFAQPATNMAVRELWEVVSALSDPVDAGFAEEFQRSTVARPVPEEFLAIAVRESLKVPAYVWRAALRGIMEDDLSASLGRIRAPTLVIWGDRDAIVPRAEQELLATSLPAARLVIHSGTGHAPHWETPERVAAELASFGFTLRESAMPAGA